MLTWIVSNGHVQEEVDTVKLLLRLQYTFLKEENERMGNREVIANVTGLLVGIIQGMVNEEELIRIVIRSLLFLVQCRRHSPFSSVELWSLPRRPLPLPF